MVCAAAAVLGAILASAGDTFCHDVRGARLREYAMSDLLTPSQDAAGESPGCVLFVDDEAPILSALRRLLRPLGYRILMAESGAAGLELLAHEEVDLVVSDMRMPQMDGAQFLEQVRLRFPKVQRMLLTGYADMNSTIAAINRGEIHRYIAKPWDDQDLLLAVREGLSRRRLEQENLRLTELAQAQNAQLAAANASLEARVKARTAEIEQINGMLEQAYAQLEQNFLLSMDVFAGLLELRQSGAAGYSRQVAQLARSMGEMMKLPARDVQDVYVAGLLHEIGKFSLPDALLTKPFSSLTSEEQVRYRKHALAAEATLMPLAELQRVARLVRLQQERFDGNGYPDGLAGDELPVAAQILALAAEYQALSEGRLSLRRPTAKEAAQTVMGFSGTHYSEPVVQAFKDVLNREANRANDRLIDASELRPGMVLARDLLSPKGSLLLAAGFRFDPRVVRQIHEYVRREGSKLTLHVKVQGDGAAEPAASAAEPETIV